MSIESLGGRHTFCAWFKWAYGWSAWNVGTGEKVKADNEMVSRWNAMARKKALRAVRETKYAGSELEFLTWLHVPEDRKHIASLLEANDFYGGLVWTSHDRRTSRIYGESKARRWADRLLARWDGLPDRGWGHYHFLGTVEGTVKAQHKRERGKGCLWVYLLPADEGASIDETKNVSSQRAYLGPASYSGGPVNMPFTIKGVTPGRYRIAAMWDRAAPATEYHEALTVPAPSKGDAVSRPSQPFSVEAGATTSVGTLECVHLQEP